MILAPILSPVLRSVLAPVAADAAEARRNLLRNPNFIGAGIPSTGPTYMGALTGTTVGVVRTITAIGTTPEGVPYIDLSFNGAATGASATPMTFEVANWVAAMPGETWTQSLYVALISGDATPVSLVLSTRVNSAAGAFLSMDNSPVLTLAGTLTREARVTTIAHVDARFVQAGMRFTPANGTTYAHTVRIAGPQIERSATATSLDLPPPGTMWT